jgi:hypothetical protein
MACPFCGHFGGYAGSPGYEPGDDDYAQAKRAAELLASAVEGEMTAIERDEARGIVRDLYRSL